jgi:ABC-2 type transport system permease protein
MGRRVLALVAKEFLAIFKDKKSRVVVIVPPLLQLLVFGYAATYDLKHVPYAIFNEDRGSASRELLSEFEGSRTFRKVSVIHNEEQMAPLIERRQALMVLRIGQRFTSDLLLGGTAQVQVVVDGRNSNTAMLVLNYARTIISRFNDRWASGATDERRPSVYLVTRAWFNPNLESRWFIVPGIAGLLTLVVTVLVTALSVAREREQGTFDQLLVTPLRPAEILLGKAIPGLLIGVAEATVIILAAVFWFQIPLLGAIGTLYTGVMLFLLSCIGIGLMISSLSVTQQQGMLGAFLFLVPAVILSGFTTPIANMPEPVQYITYLNPMRYFMIILRGVFLEAAPFKMLVGQFWPMAVIGTTSLAAAGWLFRRRLY